MTRRVIMPFGKFKGMEVKSIPNSYLRWLVSVEGISDIIREEAKRKLDNSEYDNTNIEVSRHAMDMFSKRFFSKWDRKLGFASHVAQLANDALNKGLTIIDERPFGRGVKFYYDDIVWVFNWNDEAPDYKTLITVMEPNENVMEVVEKAKIPDVDT